MRLVLLGINFGCFHLVAVAVVVVAQSIRRPKQTRESEFQTLVAPFLWLNPQGVDRGDNKSS